MYDKFKTYEKNHSINNVKNNELEKISADRHKLNKKKRKMNKHKYHSIIELDEHLDDILQSEYFIKKVKGNINTRTKRLKNFIKHGHID